jgi:hypothetical protein
MRELLERPEERVAALLRHPDPRVLHAEPKHHHVLAVLGWLGLIQLAAHRYRVPPSRAFLRRSDRNELQRIAAQVDLEP